MAAPFITIYLKEQFLDRDGNQAEKIAGHIDPITEKQAQIIIIVDTTNKTFDVHKHKYSVSLLKQQPLDYLALYIETCIQILSS